MTEENENIIQLIDEDGNEVNFEHLMTVEYEGSFYIMLQPQDADENSEEDECLIMKIVHDDETDEDVYVTLEDEDELNAVFEKCIECMEEDDEAAALDMDMDAVPSEKEDK